MADISGGLVYGGDIAALPSSGLWLPHTVTVERKGNDRRGGPANDGNATKATAAVYGAVYGLTYGGGASLSLRVQVADPMAAPRIMDRYGIEVQDQGYLVIGTADDFDGLIDGDVLVWGSKRLQVKRPKVYRPGDGIDHGELIGEDLSVQVRN